MIRSLINNAIIADPVAEDTPQEAEDTADSADNADTGDDLQMIEGIGPYYDRILRAAGITTFAQIAELSEDDILKLVSDQGGRSHPSMNSWAEQAQLANAGDLAGLQAFQDTLIGGRRPGKDDTSEDTDDNDDET